MILQQYNTVQQRYSRLMRILQNYDSPPVLSWNSRTNNHGNWILLLTRRVTVGSRRALPIRWPSRVLVLRKRRRMLVALVKSRRTGEYEKFMAPGRPFTRDTTIYRGWSPNTRSLDHWPWSHDQPGSQGHKVNQIMARLQEHKITWSTDSQKIMGWHAGTVQDQCDHMINKNPGLAGSRGTLDEENNNNWINIIHFHGWINIIDVKEKLSKPS